MQSREEYEILLNPSNSYLIKETDECVYIAEGPREIRELEHLVCTFLLSKKKKKKGYSQTEYVYIASTQNML